MITSARATADLVTSGSVSVFLVSLDASGEPASRRYLATFEQGESVFVSASQATETRLLAVPAGGATVEPWDLTELPRTNEIITQLENWVSRLAGALSSLPQPAAHIRVAPQHEIKVEPGRTVQIKDTRVAWVKVTEGRLRFASLENAIVEAGRVVPITDTLWLEAPGDAKVSVLSTEDVRRDSAELASALALFERCVLEGVRQVETQELIQKRRQIQERLKRSRYVAAEAISDIASLVRGKSDRLAAQAGARSHDALVLAAATAVGRALGVTVQAPVFEPGSHGTVEAIARASQLRVRDVVLRPGWHTGDSGPLLAQLAESKRPVALIARSPGHYEIHDPETGVRTRVTTAVAATIAPRAAAFYRPFPESALAHGSNERARWVGSLLAFSIRGCERDLLLVGILSVVMAVLGLALPQAMAALMDLAIPTGDKGLLVQLFAVLVGVALASGALQISTLILNVRIQSTADHSLQAGLWDHLLRLRMAFFRSFSSGDLETRVMAVRQIRQLLSGTAIKTLLTSGMALLQLVLLISYSPSLALIALAVLVVQVSVTVLAGASIVRTNRELVALEGSQLGLLVQLVSGIAKLRVSGAERRAFAHWTKGYTKKQRLGLDVKAQQDRVSVLNAGLSIASLALVFAAAESMLHQPASGSGGHVLSTGSFLAFNAAFGAFLGGASLLSETITTLLEVWNLAERARPILEARPESEKGRIHPGTLQGKVALERVVFRYRSSGPLTLDQVSIHAEPGELVGLVGESGSGKSTIVKLLLGFETPEEGSVAFDGFDTQGLDMAAVRRQLGVVIQGGRIAQGSIHDNIAEGRQLSIAEVQDAVRAAGLEEDVAALPMGLHTIVSEGGTNLSGGQRQRLLIARAIVARPKVLVFDEATSALDNRTQAIVNEALEGLRVTRLVIAHRLSTIKKADRIYVLDKGRVVETGTFAALAARGGIFAKLLSRQTA